MTPNILQQLMDSKVVICVGAGGVGKTTISAAFAVSAATQGKKVACLTIDPAKRLADSFGVSRLNATANLEDITHKIPFAKGTLQFGMLDAKATFDDVVKTRTSNKERANKILNNRLYKYVSGSLSGMQEYMACEKLYDLSSSDKYDIVVLDTPPSANAVDFFLSPAKMKNALDGALVKAIRRVYGRSKGLKSFFATKWLGSIFGVLSKITGSSLLDEMMDFVDALSDLFGDFSIRATVLEKMLQSNDITVMVVTTPDLSSITETVQLVKTLKKHKIKVRNILFNKCHYPLISKKIEELDSAKLNLDNHTIKTINLLNDQWNRQYKYEQELISDLRHKNIAQNISLVPMQQESSEKIDSLKNLWDELI